MIIIIGFSGNCDVKLQVALIRLRSSFGWMFTFVTFVLDLCTLCCRSCADNLYYYIRDSQRYCRGNCEPVVMCGPVKVPAGHLKGCRSCRADGSSCETGEAGEGVGKGSTFYSTSPPLTTETVILQVSLPCPLPKVFLLFNY